MNTQLVATFDSHATVFTRALSLDEVRMRAPAVFAEGAHASVSHRYNFVPTQRVLRALMNIGLVPVDARQAASRTQRAVHSRHLVRLRRQMESVRLRDAVPEIVFLNSHDGSTAYQLRMGVFRVVCTNGMIVSHGAFPGYYVSHRSNVIDEVIAAALKLAEEFPRLAAEVEQMERRLMSLDQQLQFAQRALALRYAKPEESGMHPSQLLQCRRVEDVGDDLWRTLNRVQENLMRGGLTRRSMSGRLTRTRRLTALRHEVRLNSGLWDLASETLAA